MLAVVVDNISRRTLSPADLYTAYKQWAENSNEYCLRQTALSLPCGFSPLQSSVSGRDQWYRARDNAKQTGSHEVRDRRDSPRASEPQKRSKECPTRCWPPGR